MIPRLIEKSLADALQKNRKIVLLYGARQVGKTTVLERLADQFRRAKKTVFYLNCDVDEDFQRVNTTSLTLLTRLTKGTDYLFIDEAQRIDNPGLTLKIIHDQITTIKVLATGSSSLDLKNKLSDPLTGRFLDFTLYPFSLGEILSDGAQHASYFVPDVMNFGFYPEVYLDNSPANKAVLLGKIIESYLLKDILAFQKVRQPELLKNLTRALAYQIGSEVNENELSNRLKIDRKTVVNYLDLLEKTFVIVRVYPFSKNPRREIGRNYKIYFVDLGLRNALIGDFNVPEIRQDIGRLWENFLVIERLKKYANIGNRINFNFWRSYGGAEVDYLERQSDKPEMSAFEFKYSGNHTSRGAGSFQKEYRIKVQLVNQDNFTNFIL